jgi:altronate dehydratase large subunit
MAIARSKPAGSFAFRGYRRPDGSVGTRNYVAVLPTVACANDVAERIAEAHPAARPLLHHQGCGQLQPDLRLIERTLIGLACNGNVGAVLLVSLGCEGVGVNRIEEAIAATGKPVVRVNIQELGSSSLAVRRGRAACRSLGEACRLARRSPCGPESLVVGIKCGASDMTSGLASNPAVGATVDFLVVRGGTVIVGETTEFLGAEHLLVRRAATPAVARAIRRITRDNVAVALRDLAVGTEIRVRVAGARRRVYAREAIPPGAHVHLQNVRSRRVRPGKGRRG